MNIGILLGVAALGMGVALRAAERPGARVVKTDHPPVLDGRLEERCWADAPGYSNFYGPPGSGQRTDATTFKLAHDHAWLYLGVRCANPDLYRFRPLYRTHDDPIHNDDSLELLLDPAGDGRLYVHYKLAFNNVRADQIVRDGVRDPRWNIPWLAATAQDPAGWSAELAIPLFVLVSYGDLGALAFNIARNERRIQAVDGAGEILSERQVFSTWQPVVRSLHEPDRLAPLIGVNPDPLEVPLLAALEDVTVRPYEVRNGALHYAVDATIVPVSDRGGDLDVIVSDVTTDGHTNAAQQRSTVAASGVHTVSVHIPATSMAERDITVVLRDPAAGRELGRRVLARPEALRWLSAYLDRGYYTTESQAVIQAAVGLPAGTVRDMRLEVRAGTRVVGQGAAAADTRVPFPIASWSNGTHALTLDLRQRDGTLFGSLPCALIKRPPKPGREWNIDHVNRVILNNGAPFFGIAMVQDMVGYDPQAIARCLAEHNFNTIGMWSGTTNRWLDPEEYTAYADLAGRHGLRVLARLEQARARAPDDTCDWRHLQPYFDTLPPDQVDREKRFLTYGAHLTQVKGYLLFRARMLDAAQRQAAFFDLYRYHRRLMLQSVEAIMNATNVIGYNLLDEPMDFQLPALEDIHARIHAADGYHPTFLLFSGSPPAGVEDRPLFDVLSQDPYWTPGGVDPKRNTPRYVAAATAQLHRRAGRSPRRAPIWINVSSEFFRGYRTYTRAEQECQTWLALMNGATVISYFHFIAHRETWDTLRRLNRLAAALAPALTAPSVEQSVVYRNGRVGEDGAVQYTPGAFDPDQDVFPDVQAVVKRYPDGRGVLLAANVYDRPTRCEFRIPGLAGTVSNIVSAAVLPVAGGAFTETFGGYGIAGFLLDLPGAARSIDLTVSSVVHTNAIRPTPLGLRHYVRPGKKNVLPNPSAEDATRPGYPDYFFWVPALMPDQLIGSVNPRIGQTTNEAYHGRASLMISRQPGWPSGGGEVWFYCQPQHAEETVYTFSCYAKTDTPGLRLSCQSVYGTATFVLTSCWQRCAMPWNVPPKSDAERGRLAIAPAQYGTVWLDALQVERGADATAFED